MHRQSETNGAADPGGALRVQECELRFEDGEMHVVFRLALVGKGARSERLPARAAKGETRPRRVTDIDPLAPLREE